jgi:2',3'-cyclic-nucleotide 2'-phosphodiesterase (5'-nucleotidase family)/cytochrome c
MRPPVTAFVLAALVPFAGACHKSPPPDRHATLLFFADAHAQLETHPELLWTDGAPRTVSAGGYARLASAARAIRAEVGGRALLLDGGDTFQGAAAAAWSRGDAVVGPQRALGVDYAIPGNWEVVYGAARMKELAAATGYPWLATNIVDADTGKPVFPASVVRDVGGVRVGLVGFTDPDVPIRQSPGYSKGLKYLGEETLAPAITALRERDHADVVVLVTHVGLGRSVSLAERVPGLDVILSADTHERVEKPIVRNGVLVVEPGSFASFLGRLDVDVAAGAKPRFAWKLVPVLADAYPEAPDVKAAVDAALAPYRDRLAKPLGHARAALERYGVVESTADDVLTAAVKAATHVDVALSNGFRFGTPIAPGPITEADLWALYPVVSNVKTATVTGKQLREFWESELDHVFADNPKRLFGGWLPRVNGMSVTFRARGERGHRVDRILVGGAPLDEARTYTIAACEREGDPDDVLCRIRGVAEPRRLDVTNHDIVRAYLASAGADGVGAPLIGNVHARDLPSRVFSQYYANNDPGGSRAFRERSLETDLPADAGEADRVRRGARLFVDTKHEAPEYVGNALACASCHIDGGQREGALPLVGAEAMYPSFQRRAGRSMSIEERIQGCFERSMNGVAPPPGSDVLTALTAYVAWLSDGEPRGVDPPWRGRNKIDESRRLELSELRVDEGQRLYTARCVSCHGADGQGLAASAPDAAPGTPIPTPLWGPRSFNDGAGLARVYTLAGFLRWAMPLGAGGTLTDAEAQHLAAFIDSKDRPKFVAKTADYPDGGPPVDAVYYASKYPVNPLGH